MSVVFRIEVERESDGRWLAEVVELPGVLAYGATDDEAIARVQALALRVVQIASRTTRLTRPSSRSLSWLHEPVAEHACPCRAGGSAPHWMGRQASDRVA